MEISSNIFCNVAKKAGIKNIHMKRAKLAIENYLHMCKN
jgi:hypothetical protein